MERITARTQQRRQRRFEEAIIITTVLLGTEVAVAGEGIQGVVVVTVDAEKPTADRVVGVWQSPYFERAMVVHHFPSG